MPAISLNAHYDGQKIQLDEPYELPNGARLLVTVLPVAVDEPDRSGWTQLSADGLSRAYGDDEPVYTAADVVQ